MLRGEGGPPPQGRGREGRDDVSVSPPRRRERGAPSPRRGEAEEASGGEEEEAAEEAAAAAVPSVGAVADAVRAFVEAPVSPRPRAERDAAVVSRQLRATPTPAWLVGEAVAAEAAAARAAGGVEYAFERVDADALQAEEAGRLLAGVPPLPNKQQDDAAAVASAGGDAPMHDAATTAQRVTELLAVPLPGAPTGGEVARLRSGGAQLMPLPLAVLRAAAATVLR
jgi:hypothetical protein